MAQATSNLVKSTNPTAGLLGLNPKPLATSGGVGSTQTTTPAMIKTQTPSFNFATTPGVQTPSKLSFDANNMPKQSNYSYLNDKSLLNVRNPVSSAAPVHASQMQQVTPKAPVASAAPVFGGQNSGGTMNPNYNLQTGGSAPQVPVSTRGLFPDVLSSLAYASGEKNAALGARAQKIAEDYGQKIADVGQQGARFSAGQKTTGTTPVAEGNAAVTAQTTAAQQQALAAGETAALQGNQQAISAQGQTQTALSSAGNLASPQVTAYGQTSFNPVTGEFAGGGSLPAEVMQQYAQLASTGQYSSIPSFITSNPVLNAQLNVAAKRLNPNYTPVGAAAASGVLASIPALQSANTAAEGIKNTITSYLAANPSLNPSDLAATNLLSQWIQGKQLTDPKYQTLFNYLNEYTNTLAPILGVGGDPTNLKTQIAAGFVNAAASGQSISQVLTAMSSLATNKIQDLQSGAVGGGTSVPNTASGTTGTGGFAEAW